MHLSRRNFLGTVLQQTNVSANYLAANDNVLHLLNRVTWGPRPEDVAYARNLGPAAYLEEQLHPETIDDSAADERLRRFALLTLDRRTMHRLRYYEYRSYMAVIESMVVRAVYSRRQLLERMVDFWTDHFSTPTGDDPADLVLYVRDTIRPHAFGNFEALLVATAKSPQMLVYLDNYVNVAGQPNENYGRELMELHTLGVDGGYTEDDVVAVARAFTGWTTHSRTRSGFYFRPSDHDTGSKKILGHTLPAGRGIEDGFHVLNILANHPSTARFVCYKLCLRFVSDDPPPALVDRLVNTWQANRGALKPVLRTLFQSPEFYAAAGQKLRRPLDFFIGALRATGTEIRRYWRYEEMLGELNHIPYGWKPPDGYPDTAVDWLSAHGLLARWNVAMLLTHSAYSDAADSGYTLITYLRERIGEPATVGELVAQISEQIFGVPLSAAASAPFIDYASDGAGPDTPATTHLLAKKLGSLFGLILASPLYQRR